MRDCPLKVPCRLDERVNLEMSIRVGAYGGALEPLECQLAREHGLRAKRAGGWPAPVSPQGLQRWLGLLRNSLLQSGLQIVVLWPWLMP